MHVNSETLRENAEGIRTRVAESLENAADSVRAAADQSASTLNDLAGQAGKKLDKGAKRVRSFGGGKTLGELRDRVRERPMRSLAVATALGLLVGITWRAGR